MKIVIKAMWSAIERQGQMSEWRVGNGGPYGTITAIEDKGEKWFLIYCDKALVFSVNKDWVEMIEWGNE
jgi:hypothetical protein